MLGLIGLSIGVNQSLLHVIMHQHFYRAHKPRIASISLTYATGCSTRSGTCGRTSTTAFNRSSTTFGPVSSSSFLRSSSCFCVSFSATSSACLLPDFCYIQIQHCAYFTGKAISIADLLLVLLVLVLFFLAIVFDLFLCFRAGVFYSLCSV